MQVLYTPNYEEKFILTCDASDHTIAGTLSQMVKDGEEYKDYPMGFVSKKLSGSQLNWPIIVKEA